MYLKLINWFLSLFYLLVPLGPFLQLKYNVSISPHVTLLLIVFGLVLLKNLIKPGKIKSSVIVKYLIIFFVYIFISTVIIIDSSINYDYINQINRILSLFAPVIIFIFLKRIDLTKIVSGYVLGNFLGVIIALGLLLQGEIYYGGRLTFHSEYNPTAFGAHLAFSLILFPEFYKSKYLYRSVKWLILISLVMALILSQSRNALIAIIVSVVLVLLIGSLIEKRKFKVENKFKKFTFLSIILIIVVISLKLSIDRGIISDVYFERLEILTNIADKNLNQATAGRTNNWMNYLSEPLTILGNGFSPQDYVPHGYRHNPHNVYITLLYKSGIVGLLLYVGFLFLLVRVSLKNKKYFFLLTWGSFYFIFLGVGNDIIYYSYFWIPFSLWFGVYMKSKSEKRFLGIINEKENISNR